MQRAGRVGSKRAHGLGQRIGSGVVVGLAADVLQRLAGAVADDLDALGIEADVRQAVVGPQAVEPARLLRQQVQPRVLGAAGG